MARLLRLLREQQLRCGVIAIDPTSPFSGGALLGDRIRMQDHFSDPGVFIRSVATRGAQGGLSRSTYDLHSALSLWGADVVLIETVGVGQDELDVITLADTTCVVLAPGMGDDVQANKAGILEVADVFAVNKADLAGAARVVSDLRAMLALGKITLAKAEPALRPSFGHGAASATSVVPRNEQGESSGADWQPLIVECSAARGEGVEQVLSAMGEHRHWLQTTEVGRARAKSRSEWRARRRILDGLISFTEVRHAQQLDLLARAVADSTTDPGEAVEHLLKALSDDAS